MARPDTTRMMTVLGDPSRRGIFEMLSAAPSTVGELAGRMPVSRPAVSQHLRVLTEAGLVTHTKAGTRHVYSIDPIGVAALRDYFDSLWQRALLQFKAEAERSYRELKRKKEKPQ